MKATITTTKGLTAAKFDFNPDMPAAMKAAGAKWDSVNKAWVGQDRAAMTAALTGAGYEIVDGLVEAKQEPRQAYSCYRGHGGRRNYEVAFTGRNPEAAAAIRKAGALQGLYENSWFTATRKGRRLVENILSGMGYVVANHDSFDTQISEARAEAKEALEAKGQTMTAKYEAGVVTLETSAGVTAQGAGDSRDAALLAAIQKLLPLL